MSDQPVIELQGVSVVYRLPRERVSGIKEYTIRRLQRRLEYLDFCALQDISFSVRRGEVFGVIGRNGAGKSTLLKVIARVLFPTRGRVVIHGRVAPLLELGAGFQPELTGRENVYLNSALLGRSHRETQRMFPEILKFAELEDFIDAPLRTYSTGMVARLGFAVATCVRPEILLVDEVLSVGDAQFQQKCLDRMDSFLDQGTTVVIVSHAMSTIESFCNRAIWLHAGRAEAYGPVGDVTRQYVKRFRPLPGSESPMGEVDLSLSEAVLSPEMATASKAAPVPSPSLPPVPEGVLVPTWSGTKDHIIYPDRESTYPAANVLNVQQGAVTAWVRFRSDCHLWNGILFHSDDSRYVLYVSADYSADPSRPVLQVTARAGGNRRVLDTFYGSANFPEVSVNLDQSVAFDEWHLLCITWKDYPEGRAWLYVDGWCAGEFTYDHRHDNRFRLAHHFAVGYRPLEWVGELVQNEDGTLVDLRPESTASVSGSGMELHGLRVYQCTLAEDAIQTILNENKP